MRINVHIYDGALPSAPIALEVAGAGAVVAFEGLVRSREDGRPIDGLDYETYDAMAEKSLQLLARRACIRFDLIGISVEHSRDFVHNGACAFRLRIASTHRKEALAAMDWFIDVMKQDVPIWKKPVYSSHQVESSR